MTTTTATPVRFDNWFRHRVRMTPDSTALTFQGRRWTFIDIWRDAEQMAGALNARGTRQGDRIAWIGDNHPLVFALLVACSRLGATLVPLNRRLAHPELVRHLTLARCSLIVTADMHDRCDALVADVPQLRRLSLQDEATLGWPSWREPAPASIDAELVGADDSLLMLTTSGTSGHPKGVVHSHAGVYWQATANIISRGLTADEVVLIMSPLSHIAGLVSMMPGIWMAGGQVVLLTGFDPDAVFDAVENGGVTSVTAVATLYEMLAKHPRFAGADLSSWRTAATGGAPLPVEVRDTYLERGVRMFQQYGMSEISLLCSNHLAGPDDDPDAVGKPYFLNDICVMTDEGERTTQPGAAGEVIIKSPGLFWGYEIDGQLQSRQVDEEGYFHTGDIGRIDDQGNYHLIDRLTSMIKTGGEKVYPAEVETVLLTHPDVEEVMVVGEPDQRWGETVVAMAVVRPGVELSVDQLREFGRDKLAGYKLPTRLLTVSDLPRTATGKLSRTEAVAVVKKSSRWRRDR